ncbi:MAG: methyltransferase domain-containing protein [Azospirillaceae bacterium]
MLHGLDRLVARIEAGGLDEATVYRMERLHRPPAPGQVADGVLQCPICGTRAMRFLPFGLSRRRNAACPGCGSVERHRFLWLFLVSETGILRRRLRVLHTAAEPALAERLRPLVNLRYATVDRFDPYADIKADLTDLPLPDASIDLVISSHVLEHVRDDRAALGELARVVRPGGTGVLLTPFDPRIPHTPEDPSVDTPAKRLAAYGHPFHYRIYGADLVGRLDEAGFEAVTVSSARFLTAHQRRKYRVNRNNLLLLRRKRSAGH